MFSADDSWYLHRRVMEPSAAIIRQHLFLERRLAYSEKCIIFLQAFEEPGEVNAHTRIEVSGNQPGRCCASRVSRLHSVSEYRENASAGVYERFRITDFRR